MTFGEGSGCYGQTIRRNQTLWFEESACGLSGDENGDVTNVPTLSPVADRFVITTQPTPSEMDGTTVNPIPSEVDVSAVAFVL